MVSFAERLSELMIERGIKASELAAAISVNKSSIHDWERGKYHISLSKALKLVEFFGCSLEFLMGRSETLIDFAPKPCPPFYPHFLSIMKKCGVTTYRIQKDTSIKGSYFDNWKHGTEPLMPTLFICADYLDVTVDYLVGHDRD